MKNLIILVLIITSYSKIISQNSLDPIEKSKADTANLKSRVKSVIDKYKISAKGFVHPEAYLKIIKPVFSKVILNSDDAIKNGNAISFINNAEKSTISVSTTLFFKNPNRFFNIGFTGNASNDYLFVKNEDKANYGVEGNFTFSRVINSSIYYMPDKKDKLQRKMNAFRSTVLAKELKFLDADTTALKNAVISLKNYLDVNRIYRLNTDADQQNDVSEKAVQKIVDSLTVIEATLVRLNNWRYNKDTLKSNIEEQLSDFEAKNAEINGTWVTWWEFGGKPSIQGVTYFDTTLTYYLQKGKDAFPKLALTASLNYAKNTKNLSWFISGGANVFNNYFFEGLKKTDILSYDADTRTVVAKGFTETNPDKLYYTLNPFINSYIYPFPKKILGFELATDYRISNLRWTHNFKVGILFSIAGKDGDISKGTVGIFFTGKNIDYSQKVGSEFYGYGFRVGLPINKIFSTDK